MQFPPKRVGIERHHASSMDLLKDMRELSALRAQQVSTLLLSVL